MIPIDKVDAVVIFRHFEAHILQQPQKARIEHPGRSNKTATSRTASCCTAISSMYHFQARTPATSRTIDATKTDSVAAVRRAQDDRSMLRIAASASNDISATFLVGGQPTNLTVRYFSGFIGQWNPPFLKPDELGWVCTHRHTGAAANDAYRFLYASYLHEQGRPFPSWLAAEAEQ